MNPPKHTPGPWIGGHFIQNGTPGLGTPVCRIISSADWSTKADKIKYGGERAPSAQEADANARLIALAPEMFEALEDLLSKRVSCGMPLTEPWQKIRAILAKLETP